MTKTILTAVLIVLLNVFVGCHSIDSGRAQLLPAGAEKAAVAKVADAGETDIIEQMAINRRAYRAGIQMLVEHYTDTGNNMKLRWAQKELEAIDAMPQYDYIIEAALAGPNLKAKTAVAEASNLYGQAVQLEKEAKRLVVVKDEPLLRLALNKYNQLIKKYPSSDKIDDAAYRAGTIYEYFKDYSIAVLYYERAHQWDKDTPYPVIFKAAFVLDRKLHRRAEALELYRQAFQRKMMSEKQREFAVKRIAELTKSYEALKESKP